MINKIKQFLLKQAENHQQNLMLFVIGAMTFFAGAGAIIYADNAIAPSVTQEVIALTGTVIAAIGIFIAALGYIALSVLRFFKLLSHQPKPPTSKHYHE